MMIIIFLVFFLYTVSSTRSSKEEEEEKEREIIRSRQSKRPYSSNRKEEEESVGVLLCLVPVCDVIGITNVFFFFSKNIKTHLKIDLINLMIFLKNFGNIIARRLFSHFFPKCRFSWTNNLSPSSSSSFISDKCQGKKNI